MIQPLASFDFSRRKSVLLNDSLTFSGSIIRESLIKKTLPASATFEMSILQPTHPARLAVSASGALLMINLGREKMLRDYQKIAYRPLFRVCEKKEVGIVVGIDSLNHCGVSSVVDYVRQLALFAL